MPNLNRPSRTITFIAFILIGLLCSASVLLFSELAHLNLLKTYRAQNWAWLLPISGAALFFIIERNSQAYKQVGVLQTIDAYHFPDNTLDWGELAYQFICGLLLALSGFAVGIVGPACFIAAVVANKLALSAKLSRDESRLSIACGVACAVAALFNAPIAGTVIAYELVMRHFHWRSVGTLLFCAGISSVLAHYQGGSMLKINLPLLHFRWLDLPYFLLLGMACGLAAALIVAMVRYMPRISRPKALILATLATAVAGYFNSQWLGLEPITPNEILAWELPASEQVIWLVMRFILTALIIMVAVPGGTLGPMLVIGGIIGSLLGFFTSGETSMILVVAGMGAMFGAVFRTPWAALFLIMEQTMQPALLLPTAIACISASLFTQHVFRSPSLVNLQLVRAGIYLSHSDILRKNRWAKHR